MCDNLLGVREGGKKCGTYVPEVYKVLKHGTTLGIRNVTLSYTDHLMERIFK